MTAVKLTVLGNPVPKGRPRFGRGWVHTPKQTRDAEERIRAYARKAGVRQQLRGSIRLDVAFYRDNERRVDGDNLLKLILDACNGVVWGDDSQIVSMAVLKFVDRENPRTEIFAAEMT